MINANDTYLHEGIHAKNSIQTGYKAVMTAIRLPELLRLLGVGRSTVYNRLNPRSKQYDPAFPRPIKLNSAARSGAVGWLLAEVEEYLELCVLRSRGSEGEIVK